MPYVLLVDEVQEAIVKGKDFSNKIKLPETEFSVPIWDTGTQEGGFLIHVQQAKSACKRKGLFQDYDATIGTESKAMGQAKILWKAITITIGPKSRKDAKDLNKSSSDNLKASLKVALPERKVALEAKATAAEGFFLLYAKLLSKDAWFRWDEIVSSQIGAALWTNLQRNKHKKEHGKNMESFQDCITFHLLDMFPSIAAEQQCFYIRNVLKKPQQVPVRYFFQGVEQLNSYLLHLPCSYESPRATASTKPVIIWWGWTSEPFPLHVPRVLAGSVRSYAGFATPER
jgi:hypothetical protein